MNEQNDDYWHIKLHFDPGPDEPTVTIHRNTNINMDRLIEELRRWADFYEENKKIG